MSQPTITPAQIKQIKNDMGADKYAKYLQEEIFPLECISQVWKHAAKKAMRKATPISIGISMVDLAKVKKVDWHKGPVNLFQFGVTSNAMEALNDDDLGYVNSEEDYERLAEESIKHIRWHNAKIKEVNERIQKEVEEEFAIRVQAGEFSAVGVSNRVGMRAIKE